MNIQINDTVKADVFATIFQYVKNFTENINITFDNSRMYVQAMDNARVSIFEFRIPRAWFTIYEFEMPSGITIGISSSILFRILNTRDKNQTIQIKYHPDDSEDRLYINMCALGESANIFDKHFEVPLLDLESEVMTIPEIEYCAELSLPSAHFAQIITQLKLFGDSLNIKCTEDNIVLFSDSPDLGKMSVEIKMDDLTEFSIDEGGDLDVSFSLSYLCNICLYNKLAKDIEIKISPDYPMKLIYSLTDGASIVFFLAPKINDN